MGNRISPAAEEGLVLIPRPPKKELNVLVMVKGDERYIFIYSDGFELDTLRTFGRYAACPELSFTWYDAAVLSKRVRALNPPEGI